MIYEVKTLIHPVTGQRFKLGRNRWPEALHPCLKFRDYVRRGLPAPPASVDYSPAASACLSQILLNDQLSDCTAASLFHIFGVLLGNAGTPVTWTNGQVQKFYSGSTGYIPGDPSTDQGGNLSDVLSYCRKHGLLADGSHKIVGTLTLDATDVMEYRTALWLFEAFDFGIELPDAWIDPMPSGPGFTWGAAGDPDPEAGHSFCGVGCDVNGNVTIDPWGGVGLGTLTAKAIAKYATGAANGEMRVVLSRDSINKASQKCPAGFDFKQLVADFNSLGGNISIDFQLEEDGTATATVMPVDSIGLSPYPPPKISFLVWNSSNPAIVVTPDMGGMSARLMPSSPPVLATGVTITVTTTLADGTTMSGTSGPISVVADGVAGFRIIGRGKVFNV